MKRKDLKLGETLQHLMEKKGLTIKELSYRCKVPAPTLFHFKNNRPPKNVLDVGRVAECLGVTIHYLLLGEEEPRITKIIEEHEARDGIVGRYEVRVRRIKDEGEEG